MKKSIIVLLLVSVLCLTGCGTKKGIVGKWALGSFEYTFNEDGTCAYNAAGTKMKCTYKIKGNKISILYKGSTVPFKTTYSIKGNELNIKDSFNNDTIYKRK